MKDIKRKHKNIKKGIVLSLIIVPILVSMFTSNPKGTSYIGEYHNVENIKFIYDLSYMKDGKQVRKLDIYDEQIRVIGNAEKFITLDMFLYNDLYDKKNQNYINSVENMTNKLIEKKESNDDINITFITDPMNNFYGAYELSYFKQMKDAGINLVITDLEKLKDSNPVVSGYYRCYFKWFGTNGFKWITNPLDKTAENINIRSAISLANFKANHRKTLVTDKEAIISSSNPHDGSSNHSNVAIYVKGNIINDIIYTENVVSEFSNSTTIDETYESVTNDFSEDTKVRLLTEKGIYTTILDYIKQTDEGDTINIGIFYISDFKIISELSKAANRGCTINIIADPNKDAFGIEKDGTPNRPVLTKLNKKSDNINIRWYDTHGEQYHSKIIQFDFQDKSIIILGSCNYTRRNIKGYNLESNIEVYTSLNSEVASDVRNYFNMIWNNENGDYTLDFSYYEDDSFFKYIKYCFGEFTGLSTH